MKPNGIARVFIILIALAFVGIGSAQGDQFRAAYINSQYLLTLHPVYPQLLELQEQGRADVNDLNQRAQELITKSQSGVGLSADESDLLDVTLSTLQTITNRYDAEIDALLAPAFEEISALVTETAESLGITMVFDYSAAQASGLIVYAHPSSDITELVAARLTGDN